MHTSLPQQTPFGSLTAPKRQASAQHGQKAAGAKPVDPPERSFTPRPAH